MVEIVLSTVVAPNAVELAQVAGEAFTYGVDAIMEELMSQIWGTFSSAPLPGRVD